VGQLSPMSSLKVVSIETGELVGPEERGELFFKTPYVCEGYLNLPKVSVPNGFGASFYSTKVIDKLLVYCQYLHIYCRKLLRLLTTDGSAPGILDILTKMDSSILSTEQRKYSNATEAIMYV